MVFKIWFLLCACALLEIPKSGLNPLSSASDTSANTETSPTRGKANIVVSYFFFNYWNICQKSLFLLTVEGCGPCPADNRRLNLKKYCKRDYGNFIWILILFSIKKLYNDFKWLCMMSDVKRLMAIVIIC